MRREITLCAALEIPQGSGRQFQVGDREVAVFHVEGEFFALDGTCPHQGGPLGEGFLYGEEISCPLHGWAFSIRDGKCELIPNEAVACIPIRVEAGQIIVDIEQDEESHS